jgi:hypothetical protein
MGSLQIILYSLAFIFMNMASPMVKIVPAPSSIVARTYNFRPSCFSTFAVHLSTPGVGTGLLYVVLRSDTNQFCRLTRDLLTDLQAVM